MVNGAGKEQSEKSEERTSNVLNMMSHEEGCDEEECVGLVAPQAIIQSKDCHNGDDAMRETIKRAPDLQYCGCFLLGFTAALGLMYLLILFVPQTSLLTKPHAVVENETEFSCPVEVSEAENYDTESFIKAYTNTTEHIEENLSTFLESFRDTEFDGWDKTYEEVKAALYGWKSKHYPDYLECTSICFTKQK